MFLELQFSKNIKCLTPTNNAIGKVGNAVALIPSQPQSTPIKILLADSRYFALLGAGFSAIYDCQTPLPRRFFNLTLIFDGKFSPTERLSTILYFQSYFLY